MSARADPRGGCVRKTRNRHAVRKMEVDPPEPPCRGRLQTAISCFGSKDRGGERYGKRRDSPITSCMGKGDEWKRTSEEASKGFR